MIRHDSTLSYVARASLVCLLAASVLASCHDHAHDDHAHGGGDDHAHAGSGKDGPTNRVAIPEAVRNSLGITFAKAEERSVSPTLRLAGHVEPTTAGQQPFHANLAGTVTIHVQPLQRVKTGDLLVSIASSELLEARHELHTQADQVGHAEDVRKVDGALLTEASATLRHIKKRLASIRSAGASKAGLTAEMQRLKARVQVLRVKRGASSRAVVRAEHRFEAELARFASQVGMSISALREADTSSAEHGDTPPRWETMERLEMRARADGVVTDLPLRTGAWVELGGKVAQVTDPSAVWVKCKAIPSDLSQLRDGQKVEISAAGRPRVLTGITTPAGESAVTSVIGTLRVGVASDDSHTFPVYVALDAAASKPKLPAWFRSGVTVFADVRLITTNKPETVIPKSALVRDGLETIFFRRDPSDPDKAVRTVADMGPDDGQWVTVYSGVAPKDEVVVDGAYELKLATKAAPAEGGHFHSDGSFHKGKE